MPYWSTVCIAGAITLTVNYFYYMLSKKTTYMISHLNSKAQIDAWLDIYREMHDYNMETRSGAGVQDQTLYWRPV
mgnify:CR=1 FL=1